MSCWNNKNLNEEISNTEINVTDSLKFDNPIQNNLCEKKITEFNIDEISISGVEHGASSSEIEMILGNPDSITEYDNELSNEVHSLYYYGESYFDLVQDSVVSFNIEGSKLIFDNLNLTSGSSLLSCTSLSLIKIKNGRIRIPIKYRDEAIIFAIDQNKNVKSIYHWVNW
ncbi:hypothetical protein ACE939_03570 [Aquimarina sp. W85]|uniref:hypothetical protein n=1 Tax=Aquimarina rhodophyticola TaxID=3342246 RepID=UPI003670CF2E